MLSAAASKSPSPLSPRHKVHTSLASFQLLTLKAQVSSGCILWDSVQAMSLRRDNTPLSFFTALSSKIQKTTQITPLTPEHNFLLYLLHAPQVPAEKGFVSPSFQHIRRNILDVSLWYAGMKEGTDKEQLAVCPENSYHSCWCQ